MRPTLWNTCRPRSAPTPEKSTWAPTLHANSGRYTTSARQNLLRIQNGRSGFGEKQLKLSSTAIAFKSITETVFCGSVLYDIAGISRCSREPVVLCRQRLCLASMRVPGVRTPMGIALGAPSKIVISEISNSQGQGCHVTLHRAGPNLPGGSPPLALPHKPRAQNNIMKFHSRQFTTPEHP